MEWTTLGKPGVVFFVLFCSLVAPDCCVVSFRTEKKQMAPVDYHKNTTYCYIKFI